MPLKRLLQKDLDDCVTMRLLLFLLQQDVDTLIEQMDQCGDGWKLREKWDRLSSTAY